MGIKKAESRYRYHLAPGSKEGIIIGAIIAIISLAVEFNLSNTLETIVTKDQIAPIAELLGQLSATLIGFTALAAFFFLGSFNTVRLRFLQTQRFLFRSALSAAKPDDVKEWKRLSRRISEALGGTSRILVWAALIVIVIFSLVIVLAVLALAFLNAGLLGLGIGLVISGTATICGTLVLTERELNGMHEIIADAEEIGLVGSTDQKPPSEKPPNS